MFSNISWKDYSIFILAIVCIYYAIVFIVFYKTEIMSIIAHISVFRKDENKWLVPQATEEKAIDSNTNRVLEQLKSEIIVALQTAKTKKLIRDEVMLSIQLILHNYDSIRHSESRQIINNYKRSL
jgi:hypothetical protein